MPGRDTLGVHELREVVLELEWGDEAEGVVVRARADRADDLLRLGGRKNELHMFWRFLHQLEQGIEALIRDHVGLVDDEDLESITHRREAGLLAKLAGVVDTSVRGGVHLHYVE